MPYTSDKKIQDLDAGTTPLDGTELVPIKKSSDDRAKFVTTQDVADLATINLSAIGAVPNANGASLSSNTLNLQPASGSFGGVVTTVAQTFAGAKTFLSDITVNGMSVGIGTGSISSNIVLGASPLFGANVSGSANIALGTFSLVNNVSGSSNIGIGLSSLNQNNSSFNVGIGGESLLSNSSGLSNTALGYKAGRNITGSYNIAIGARVTIPTAANSGQLNIGNVIYGTGLYQGTALSGSSTPTATGSIAIGLQVPTARLHLAAGTATVNTAPLKFTSGTLLGTAEAGAIEFLTDKYYGTITTGAVRHTFATLESTAQTFSNDISVPDEAYDATAWNGSLEVPTKNAIRDKIESMGTSSGVWTPTLTNVSNANSLTAFSSHYMRIGNQVSFSGKVTLTQATQGDTTFGISLPIASNFGTATDAAGTGTCVEFVATADGIYIEADTTNDRLQMRFNTAIAAVGSPPTTIFFTGHYTII